MDHIYQQWKVEKTKLSRNFFLSPNAYSIGPKIYNNENYFYDLSAIQQENPLGFNHPLVLRSNNNLISRNSHYELNQIYILFQQLFEQKFNLNLNFFLVEIDLNTTQSLGNYLLADNSLFNSIDGIAQLNKALDSHWPILIPVYDNFYLAATPQFHANLSAKRKNSVARINLLEEKYQIFRFYLLSNLLEEGGKVDSLNQSLSRFAKSNTRIDSFALGLKISPSDSVLHEELKQHGVFTEFTEDQIILYFPLTTKEEELEEILSVIANVIREQEGPACTE